MKKPVGVEPAGGVAWSYQAVTTVAIIEQLAAWTQPGPVDHAPIGWRIINTTVGSCRDRQEMEDEIVQTRTNIYHANIINGLCEIRRAKQQQPKKMQEYFMYFVVIVKQTTVSDAEWVEQLHLFWDYIHV